MPDLAIARSELILGGQKSGKTARAEALAAAWLAQSPTHEAVYIATAQAWDEEMRERIARHRRDRAERVPRMRTVEEPLALAHAIGQNSRPDTLVVVDCLTLWLTALLMPAVALEGAPPQPTSVADAIRASAGPLVLISNEIGLGVVPLGRDVRRFVDALGTLNQQAAAACERVTLMSAGLPMTLKAPA
ncbi:MULTISPECIES: bifunctional adenosylcobinamide kinase/adenosylcobinamide-phosphate guanylyltransferase [Ramlibacter]|uniref:Bifunctional adenosylcobalamin biosynthesis protein n=1 Tax=Ramlibacter pinisoli TaxID=2682844 RepID=A0A6N8IZQ0_9BURK|nr:MULTISPECIES: bifunctional adenosylcobinamide kinase/adenosylcobinamide-phosphate guanylyltransferase [Ramlibacter]MBA2961472.1 bifunctional adenosylcobinamide kinase/adenosylcobinamide-phosphate guanylyltransferase [Ramlibacter sp. CGMCC 1.13660]MVQ31416.1 adenosylcobinamide-phosphate guanylyltransferase [Ramlibacter pinisoli]